MGGFDTKRAAYLKSGINMTKDIAQNPNWTKEKIEDRSRELMIHANNIWHSGHDLTKPDRD